MGAINGETLRVRVFAARSSNRETTDEERSMVNSFINEYYALQQKMDFRYSQHYRPYADSIRERILNSFPMDCGWQEIPNEYTQIGYPWYLVATNRGIIKVGWRKRVIELNWEGSFIEQSAVGLFPNEDVTRSGRLIHTWSYEKLLEYVQILLAAPSSASAV